MTRVTTADVLIVGGGPVGLAVAALLGQAGIPVTVLEQRDRPTPPAESRAITWMPEGLLLADRLGITAELAARAQRRTVHEFRRSATGRSLLRLDLNRLDHPHPYSLNLPQHDSEDILERAATASGTVTVVRNQRVVAVDQDATGVHVTTAADGAPGRTWSARYGVGCDGARSSRSGVARLLGISARYTDYGADTGVADIDADNAPADPATSYIALAVGRPYGAFCFGPGRWRVVYRLNPGETRTAMTSDETVRAMAARALPGARVTGMLWSSVFRLGQGQSAAYARGRWVLAGDAAHAMGPSAGAGMMTGLLGSWRLARHLTDVLRAGADPATAFGAYEREQRRASQAIQRANRLTFRNIALHSEVLGGLRLGLLAALGTVPAITRRITATDALVGLGPR